MCRLRDTNTAAMKSHMNISVSHTVTNSRQGATESTLIATYCVLFFKLYFLSLLQKRSIFILLYFLSLLSLAQLFPPPPLNLMLL